MTRRKGSRAARLIRVPRSPPILPAELLRQLWHDPQARSRNRNFERFRDDPVYRAAVRHIRSLRAFCRDVERFRPHVSVVYRQLEDGGIRLTLRASQLRLRRHLFISAVELELLLADPFWRDIDVPLAGERVSLPSRRS
jgi:hypothetical protein